MTWFLMNKGKDGGERDVKSFGKYKTQPEREMLQRPWKSLTKANDNKEELSFNLMMPFLPCKPLKTGDPTLYAQSFKRIIQTKSQEQNHSSLWQKYSGLSRCGGSLRMKRNDFEFWMRGILRGLLLVTSITESN